MKKVNLILLLFFVMSSVFAHPVGKNGESFEQDKIDKPLYSPFIERYILDELKLLRKEKEDLRVEILEKVTSSKLDVSDRAIRYTADTTTNIFYIITIAASLLVLLGWRSLHDVKKNVERVTAKQITTLTKKYEARLNDMEKRAKIRSGQIIDAQQEITNTNIIHSLWMRAGIEKSELEKINIFDEILELNPNDIEALTYKADTLLDIDEDQWSLSLSNQAIEIDDEYALAYWQRACAKAKLELYDEAVSDIKLAIDLAESLKDEIKSEAYFENLKSNYNFQVLIGEIDVAVLQE